MLQVDQAGLDEDRCLGGAITGVAGGVERAAEDGIGFSEVTAVSKVPSKDGGQPDGVARPGVSGGVRGGRDQGGAFGIEPVSCCGGVGQRRDRRAGPGDLRMAVAFGREQAAHGRGGGMQVVVEQARQCRVLLLVGVLGGAEFAGVAPEQVVQTVPARSGGLDQMSASQCVQCLSGLRFGGGGEGCSGVGIEVGAGGAGRAGQRSGGAAGGELGRYRKASGR